MAIMRYVVLHHTGVGEAHFDVMFERAAGSALTTFRVLCWPVRGRVAAKRLADHRAAYLEYEGPVSGGRGEIQRVESGRCEIQNSGPNWTLILGPAGGTVLRFEFEADDRFNLSAVEG